jgi:hypothetical protein
MYIYIYMQAGETTEYLLEVDVCMQIDVHTCNVVVDNRYE